MDLLMFTMRKEDSSSIDKMLFTRLIYAANIELIQTPVK